MNASNTPLHTCIGGISGADNIAQMWRNHYSDIFNSVNISMSNRAEKDAVRWCHLTHQVFAGGIGS